MDTVGIIAPGNRKYLPYVEYYLDVMRKHGIQYKLMTWNKAGIQEESDMSFCFQTKDSDRKRMLLGYLIFSGKCIRYIKKNAINKLVILTAAPAYFMGMGFSRHCKKEYILDIRDDSPLVRKFPHYFARVCKNAKAVIVSSPYFEKWVPCSTIMCHNADISQIHSNISQRVKRRNNDIVSIVYAGMMIEPDSNIEFLKLLKEDKRYRFFYIGRSGASKEKVIQYAKNSGMENVIEEGTYNKNDIISIYQSKADFINIIRADTVINRNALPNKLYDAAISGVPVIVYSHNEAIAQYVREYHLGIVLDEVSFKKRPSILYEEIMKFDYSLYEDGRREFLSLVMEQMLEFEKTVFTFARN